MTRGDMVPTNKEYGLLSRPWPLLLITGLGATALASVLSKVVTEQGETAAGFLFGVRLLLLGIGLLATGGAVVCRPRSALVLVLAAVVAWMASQGMDAAWDSARFLTVIAAVVAAVAAVLVRLPPVVSRGVVSLLIVIHFGGILTAVTSVPPPGGPAPWLTTQLWTHFYRPYLQFMYLNNAYHFYSPDPGPATLLWCCVDYADGSTRWVKIPSRSEHAKDPLALEYYRRLSITESTNQIQHGLGATPESARRRTVAGQLKDIPSPDEIALLLPGVPQYRVPVDNAKQLLQSYARFLTHKYPHTDPAIEVTGVKIYRVVHGMVPASQLAAGMDPLDPRLYLPYFQGAFDKGGNLKDADDPFLYWLLPIFKVETIQNPALLTPGSFSEVGKNKRREYQVRDYVAIHAGSSPGRDGE
jgi:hypothetical protein